MPAIGQGPWGKGKETGLKVTAARLTVAVDYRTTPSHTERDFISRAFHGIRPDPLVGSGEYQNLAGRAESRRAGLGGVRISWVGLGRVRVSNLMGRVGSGRVALVRPDPREVIRPATAPSFFV